MCSDNSAPKRTPVTHLWLWLHTYAQLCFNQSYNFMQDPKKVNLDLLPLLELWRCLRMRVIVLLPATVFHNTDLIVPKVKSCSTASQAVDATATALPLGVTRRFIFEKDPCCVGLLRAVHIRSVSEALLHCINARHAK